MIAQASLANEVLLLTAQLERAASDRADAVAKAKVWIWVSLKKYNYDIVAIPDVAASRSMKRRIGTR